MKGKQRNNNRIWIIAFIVCQIVIIFYQHFFSQSMNNRLHFEIQQNTKEAASKTVHIAYNSVEHIIEKVRSGELTKEQARKAICDIVRKYVYTDDMGQNYVFMSSYDGTMLVQPFDISKEGTNQLGLMDADGNYIIKELIAAAKNYPNGSFVTYSFFPPNQQIAEEKLSYVIGIPEIDAYIGTGMYANASLNGLKQLLKDQRQGYIFINLFVLFSLLMFIATLYRSNKQLSKEINERIYAETKLTENYYELENARNELQQNHDELSALYEEIAATEEELRRQYDELKDSQQQSQELSERYLLVAEGSSDVIWDWDARNNKLFMSDRIAELLGYSSDEFKIDTAEDYLRHVHPDDRENSLFKLETASKQGSHFISYDYRMLKKDGSYGWFSSRSKFIFSKNGEVLRNAGSISDITQSKKYEEEIKKLAYYDSLTGLPNRVSLYDELEKSIIEHIQNGKAAALIFTDLDNFKFINDTFGHSYGDRVLVRITEKLNTFSSESIKIFRLGGDEFILIQNSCVDDSCCVKLAEKIISLFSHPINIDDNRFHITCSIGVAIYPRLGSTAEELLKFADLAMYKAKISGKNRYVLYEQSIGTELSERIRLERDLKEAFENSEFELYYQPQVDTESRIITGFEALLRWNSSKYGLVMPGTFIHVAEEMGLINDMGKWVIDQSFAFAQRLQGKGICISCNVSPIQLIQSDFIEYVIEIFDRYDLAKGSVAVEITENSLVESFEDTNYKLDRLREKGILIYLDDFGTGYSSLTYLKNLPIDAVKIDKLFVDGIKTEGFEKNIIKSIISLAHDLGLTVVAEGVEEEIQREYLAMCKCSSIQGYLISKPVPEKLAVAYLTGT